MPTPCSRAMARMLLPAARAARIARTLAASSATVAGRPSRVPPALARASPAMTRSRIMIVRTRQRRPSFETSPCLTVWSCRSPADADTVDVRLAWNSCKMPTRSISDRPSRSTLRPRQIELFAGDGLQQLVQARPLVASLAPTALIPVDADDLPAVTLRHDLQFDLLRS